MDGGGSKKWFLDSAVEKCGLEFHRKGEVHLTWDTYTQYSTNIENTYTHKPGILKYTQTPKIKIQTNVENKYVHKHRKYACAQV